MEEDSKQQVALEQFLKSQLEFLGSDYKVELLSDGKYRIIPAKKEFPSLNEWMVILLGGATGKMAERGIPMTPENLSTFFQRHYELPWTPQEAEDWLKTQDWYQEK